MEEEQGATGGKASPTLESPPDTPPVNGVTPVSVSDQESQDVKVCLQFLFAISVIILTT